MCVALVRTTLGDGNNNGNNDKNIICSEMT